MCWVFGGPTNSVNISLLQNDTQHLAYTLYFALCPMNFNFGKSTALTILAYIFAQIQQTSDGYGETRQFAAFFTVLALCMIIYKLYLLFCQCVHNFRKSFDNIKGKHKIVYGFSKCVLTFKT